MIHIPAILVGLLMIFIDVRKPKPNTANEVTR